MAPWRVSTSRIAGALFLLGLLIAHVLSVYTENINWDEFALLSRAADTLRTGQLRSGGRPGLGTLILIPFVDACSDSIAAVRSARLLWVGFTVALVWGFWALLASLPGGERRSWASAAIGVALLALVPAFLRFSLQVRTDQPAVALGLWAGVALLASRRRAPWALLAGILFGTGFLFSQKLIYVAALAGLLTVGDLFLRRELRVKRELTRASLCLVAGVAVLAAYRSVLPLFTDLAPVQSLGSGMNVFAFYRADFGYAYYVRMLPTLLPHLILLALLVNATGSQLRSDGRWRRMLLAWAVLALGAAVLLFHAGAFPYFWMTLGLFPAAAAAIAFEPIRDLYGRQQAIVLGSIGGLLVVQSSLTAAVLLKDSQRGQRESLAFVGRNFESAQQGFHPERAFFCRDPDDPFPVIFSQTIAAQFWGSEREGNGSRLIDEFRKRPVAFMLESFRLQQFPPEIREFWSSNYKPYYESVRIPALELTGEAGQQRGLTIIVPGEYRFRYEGEIEGPSVRIDDRVLAAGHSILLGGGSHLLEFLRDVDRAELIFAVTDPPKQAVRPFYKRLTEIGFRW